MANGEYSHALICHPATQNTVVRSIEAAVRASADGSLHLDFLLRGDMARLRLPEGTGSAHTDGLWQHTCFEAFVAADGSQAYREFNFSPSGQWAAYAFVGYRQPDTAFRRTAAIDIAAQCTAGSLRLTATIPALLLPSAPRLHLGLSAVVESADTLDGAHTYWALAHPAPRPDFHHHDTFMLEILTHAHPDFRP